MLVCVQERQRERSQRGISTNGASIATIIGQVTSGRLMTVWTGWRNRRRHSVGCACPRRRRAGLSLGSRRRPAYLDEAATAIDLASTADQPQIGTTCLLTMLGSPNICHKGWVFEQYDSMVRTNTAVGPGSDAAVIRIRQTDKALAMATDCNGRYCYLNPRLGAQIAVPRRREISSAPARNRRRSPIASISAIPTNRKCTTVSPKPSPVWAKLAAFSKHRSPAAMSSFYNEKALGGLSHPDHRHARHHRRYPHKTVDFLF